MAECIHSPVQEFRITPDRFITPDTTMSLEETLELPLKLSRMPHNINSLSPTPLDPYALRINGSHYDEAALKHMLHSFDNSVEQYEYSHESEIKRAQMEIEYQHFHRMKKNDEAMSRWRELAATDPRDHMLTHAEAEGVMQVRAGVSKIGAIVILLAKNPEIGAIETSKATRPFCLYARDMAAIALMGELNNLSASSPIDMQVAKDSVPYRASIDQHHGAFISKSLLATSRTEDVDIEIVGRESGLLYVPGDDGGSLPESQKRSFGPVDVEMVPIDMTSYARVRST